MQAMHVVSRNYVCRKATTRSQRNAFASMSHPSYKPLPHTHLTSPHFTCPALHSLKTYTYTYTICSPIRLSPTGLRSIELLVA